MFYRTLFILSALILTIHSEGQRIQVISSWDRSPIEHVGVFNSTRKRAAITDSLGMINLSIFSDSDTITFQHPSFITVAFSRSEISAQPFIVLHRKRILIDEYVISASKSRESKLIIPYMVDVMDQNVLYETTGITAAEILEGTGNIMVQKTQGGGGSPILRGF